MLIVFFLECGHENQEGGHINFQAERRSISVAGLKNPEIIKVAV